MSTRRALNRRISSLRPRGDPVDLNAKVVGAHVGERVVRLDRPLDRGMAEAQLLNQARMAVLAFSRQRCRLDSGNLRRDGVQACLVLSQRHARWLRPPIKAKAANQRLQRRTLDEDRDQIHREGR